MHEDEIETIRRRIRADSESGIERSLKDYVDLFPKDETAVARAFAEPATPEYGPDRGEGMIGPYRPIKELGRGGQGIVWLARDTRVDRKVALKVLVGLGAASEEVMRRFRREAEITSRLDHPGICSVHGTGLADNVPWIAMRYVRGRPLSALIARSVSGDTGGESEDAASKWVDLSRLDEETTDDEVAKTIARKEPSAGGTSGSREEMMTVLAVIEKIARALHAAHEVGVVHRDIKPGNIMVTDEGDPVVLDFGLASADVDGQPSLTQSGDVLGTPSYMSPEQIMGRRSGIDRRTDVYSLGVTLYECLTLHRPFSAPTREALYREILTRSAPNPAKLNPSLPPELGIVIETAMAKEPERRYMTAEALAEDLRRVRELKPITARRVSRWLRMKRWAQRNPAVATLSLLLFIALTSGLAWTIHQNRQLRSSEESARNSAGVADTNARLLGDKVDAFNRLSAVVSYERLVATEEDLHPAWPDRILELEAWLQDFDGLLQRRPEFERVLGDLKARALAPSASQRHVDRESHPEFSTWDRLRRQVASLRYADEIRSGSRPFVEPELTEEEKEWPAQQLIRLAGNRIPIGHRGLPRVHGDEARALAFARHGIGKHLAGDENVSTCTAYETLAWTCFANGLDDEAVAAGERAVKAARGPHKEDHRRDLAALEDAIDGSAERLSDATEQLAALSEAVERQRVWRFAEEADGFLHDALSRLLGELDRIEKSERVGVARRLDWANQIRELSLRHPKARVTWEEARAAIIESRTYFGNAIELPDEEVIGLVPIGENPVTGLWEFYHLRSAWDGESDPSEIAIPTHAPDGTIEVTDATGIVFVLLPQVDEFIIGAQSHYRNHWNYDALAEPNEWPCSLKLDAFFVARHEMTQAQWARLWSGDERFRHPSQYDAGETVLEVPVELTHPVEQVSWFMCDQLLARHGLVLPTEAQWEYACRGGTRTPWFCERSDLGKHANLADAAAKRQSPSWSCESWDDGLVSHGPVGSYLANPFGLHDVLGNVSEWVLDVYGDYTIFDSGLASPRRPGDGLGLLRGGTNSILRGGGYDSPASSARSAIRISTSSSHRNYWSGVRAARSLRPKRPSSTERSPFRIQGQDLLQRARSAVERDPLAAHYRATLALALFEEEALEHDALTEAAHAVKLAPGNESGLYRAYYAQIRSRVLDRFFNAHSTLAGVLAAIEGSSRLDVMSRFELRDLARQHGELARLEPLSSEAESTAASTGSNKATTIRLINDSEARFRWEWIDPNGKPQPYGIIEPRTKFSQRTYAGHMFRATEMTSGKSALFRAEESRGILRLPW